jgi:hypothetical protein
MKFLINHTTLGTLATLGGDTRRIYTKFNELK